MAIFLLIFILLECFASSDLYIMQGTLKQVWFLKNEAVAEIPSLEISGALACNEYKLPSAQYSIKPSKLGRVPKGCIAIIESKKEGYDQDTIFLTDSENNDLDNLKLVLSKDARLESRGF